MKTVAFMALFLVCVVAFGGGCASSPYLKDRQRDLADIVTVTAGAGAGVKGRVGPIQIGLMFNCAEAGLRGGEFVAAAPFEKAEAGIPKSLDLLFFAYGIETFNGGPLAPERGKSFHALTVAYLTAPVPEGWINSKAKRTAEGPAKYSPVPYWTEIEAAVGVGGTLRLGLNPGELLDFLIGWTTLDIFGDDVEVKKEEPAVAAAAK